MTLSAPAPSSAAAGAAEETGPKPLTDGQRGIAAQIVVYAFTTLPLLAVVVAVPFAWNWAAWAGRTC